MISYLITIGVDNDYYSLEQWSEREVNVPDNDGSQVCTRQDNESLEGLKGRSQPWKNVKAANCKS